MCEEAIRGIEFEIVAVRINYKKALRPHPAIDPRPVLESIARAAAS